MSSENSFTSLQTNQTHVFSSYLLENVVRSYTDNIDSLNDQKLKNLVSSLNYAVSSNYIPDVQLYTALTTLCRMLKTFAVDSSIDVQTIQQFESALLAFSVFCESIGATFEFDPTQSKLCEISSSSIVFGDNTLTIPRIGTYLLTVSPASKQDFTIDVIVTDPNLAQETVHPVFQSDSGETKYLVILTPDSNGSKQRVLTVDIVSKSQVWMTIEEIR